jgi:hypothetical protein
MESTFLLSAISRWIFAIAILVGISGCFNSDLEWREEVKLQSGEVLTVKRTVKGVKSFGELGGPGGWSSESMTVSVVQPAGPDNPPIWDGPFVPLLFDRDAQSGQWFMVATFYSCESWYGLGKPKLPYTEYHLKNGKWQQQSLSPGLIGRQANMLTSIHSTGEADHTLASKEKSERGASPEYRSIVSDWSTGC